MPVFQLIDNLVFPDPRQANDDGILAVGGDLSIERLLLAYSNGIFPWFSKGDPIIWWSPDPRLVLFPQKFKISKSLRRTITKGNFVVTFDKAFSKVLEYCSKVPRKDQADTWITTEMLRAYENLYQKGYAHSVEVWQEKKLVGGLYGVSLGKVFFGESMFHLATDASKVAFATLIEKLTEWEFDLVDAQVNTDHLVSLGAENIDRDIFLQILSSALQHPTKIGNWGVI